MLICLEMMPSWCRQVNWGNCGIPWVNCAVLYVKDDWKYRSEACAIACQNFAVYSVFPSGMTSHNNVVQFTWASIVRFRTTDIWLLMQRKQLLRTSSVVTKYVRLLHAALLSGVRKKKHVPLAVERLVFGRSDSKLRLSLCSRNTCLAIVAAKRNPD